MRIAVTGGTGFVGSRLLPAAVAAGHRVRALTRRDQDPADGIEWVSGSLSDGDSLRALVKGCDTIIHVAGVINAPDSAQFEMGNVAGTKALVDAARETGVRRFVHVSSLAAREPGVSLYGASKARSEEVVQQSDLDWAIVRPPAVYGPGDRETLDLFRMARSGWVVVPPEGRISLIHVDDLVRLLLALSDPEAPSGLTVEPDDGRAGGWSHREFAVALGKAVGPQVRVLSAPASLVRLGAVIDRGLRGDSAKLTPDRAAYFCHPDWVCSGGQAVPGPIWSPAIETNEGLRETAEWYVRQGWLRR